MIFGSICSGIEAASVAWKPLGWSCAFMSEIETFPRAVLKHHYPEIPLHGDFTTIQAGQYAAIDVLVGGTPCQSFSIAGLRGGMADCRGNLALEYLRLAGRLRPRWIVWENVPGVLSSNAGRDFGSFVGGLVKLGYGFAYRVLDAQYFGLAQRRKRVFVVGYLGDWRRAAAVLFEPASLRGDSAPSREARKGTAIRVAPCLDASFGRLQGASNQDANHGHGHLIPFGGNNTTGPIDIATACNAHGGPMGRMDFETETFIVHPLRAEGFDASEGGTGRGTPIVAVHAIQAGALRENPASGSDGVGVQDDIAYTIEARSEGQAVGYRTSPNRGAWETGDRIDALTTGTDQTSHAVSVALRGRDGGATAEIGDDVAFALRGSSGGGSKPHVMSSAVRRLTPRECERLQGFPDDYTLIPWRGGLAPDGPRYKALGNSMAVPVMFWIGRRIAAEDAR